MSSRDIVVMVIAGGPMLVFVAIVVVVWFAIMLSLL